MLRCAENMKQPRWCGRPWCHGTGQRNTNGQRDNAVADERLGDLLTPLLNRSFDGESVLQMKLFGLEDRQLACWQILWKFGGMRKNKDPAAVVELKPTRSRHGHEPSQLLNAIIH